jgi:hypothetical protein
MPDYGFQSKHVTLKEAIKCYVRWNSVYLCVKTAIRKRMRQGKCSSIIEVMKTDKSVSYYEQQPNTVLE